MENKVRYQYSYFIYPFVVKNYETYLYSLLKNKKIQLNMFEKEKDMELYTYFLEPARDYYLNTIEWAKEKRKAFESMDDKLKASILSKIGACYFSYPLEKQIHGKIGKEELFFTIDEIRIACMASKNCFLLLKTHIENLENIRQVLDFNYKFSQMNTIQGELKDFEKIRIQSTQFETSKEIQSLLKEITNKEELRLPYVHSYVCMDSEIWNKPEDFEGLKEIYQRYVNLQPNNVEKGITNSPKEIISNDYAKMSIGKEGNFLFVSSTKNENYTKLPYFFETTYLYSYLIRLEQKETLTSLFEEEWTGDLREKWERLLARGAITQNAQGEIFYKALGEEWAIGEMEKRLQEYQQTQFQKEEVAKNKKWNKILLVILTISILLNLYNLVMNLRQCF